MSAQLQVTGEAKIRDIQGPVVANSGVITALDGAASQYVRGDGTLADFPTSSGGGSSVSYYLNSSVSQGTIGGVAYRELSKDPIIGGGTDIAISSNGYVASYITDANDPDVVLVPGGNFNCEFYFSVNNNTGNPTTYAELYKYDGTTFTLLGSSVGVPESINQGTTIAPYYFAIPVATATLALTDRLAIRIYVNVDGRTVTLHTENSHLCQVVTTLSKGMVSLNNLTDQSQNLTTGTSGTNFAIVSSGDTHTFNLPVASATNTGKLSSTDWSTFNNKQNALTFTAPLNNTTNTISIPAASSTVDGYLDNTDWTTFNNKQNAITLTTTGTSGAATLVGATLNIPQYTDQYVGTVTSVGLSAPTGFSVSGSPVTSSGTLALSFASGYSLPTTAKQTEWDTAYTNRITSASFPLSISSNAISISLASASTAGYLSIADWNTFNGKQNALTNPVTGTGNANYVALFNGTSTIGNSIIYQDGLKIGIMNATPTTTLDVSGGGKFSGSMSALSFVKSGGTSSEFLKADGSVDSNTYITATSISASSPLFYNSGTGVFTISAATGSTNGYLSSTDWLAFYAKQDAITLTTTGTSGAATLVGSTLNIPQYEAGITDLNGLTASSQYFATGTSGTDFSIVSSANIHTFNLPTASDTNRGLLSSADWTTFNNKQNALTNPVTGTGTTNTLPKFTAASTIGNSNITDSGSLITLGSNSYVNGALGIGTSSLNGRNLLIDRLLTGTTVSISVFNISTIASDVTNTATSFRSSPSTQAAAFTLGTLNHFQATNATIGAGSSVTYQIGFSTGTLSSATNNWGFYGQVAAATNSYNLYMSGTADNYLAGSLGIGSVQVNGGPILTITLTSGGSGYVDGTYTDVAMTGGGGQGALATFVVSGGIVTTATLTWGGANYIVGGLLSASNANLGGTGSGLSITVATVDSSQFSIGSTTGGDITLFRNDTTLNPNDNIGTIKWLTNDTTTKASGIVAEIGAFGESTNGGATLRFYTRAGVAGSPLVEAMRVAGTGGVGIGATTLFNFSLRVSKDITGSTSCAGIINDGVVQSGVTTQATYIQSSASTAAASFTIGSLRHFRALQGTIGAGSTVTSQYGFEVDSSLIGATNNYGFYGNIPSGTGRWNLYMNGTANNYLAGSLGIGSTSLTGYSLKVSKNITGATISHGITSDGTVLADVTSNVKLFNSILNTNAATFNIGAVYQYFASQGSIGAGNTITNQFGFFADASITGATNNYGFYGNIASGTNRWNLYMAGTAANYLAGKLLIGSTTDSGEQLQVTGTAKITGAATFSSSVTINGLLTNYNTFNTQTASYTLVLADASKIVETNVSTANTVTVPTNASVAFPIGTEITIMQYGGGVTTINAASGVTINSKSNARIIANRYTGATLVKRDTDEWYLIGNIVP